MSQVQNCTGNPYIHSYARMMNHTYGLWCTYAVSPQLQHAWGKYIVLTTNFILLLSRVKTAEYKCFGSYIKGPPHFIKSD